VIAIYREGQVLANPKSQTVFQAGDHVGLIGEPEQIAAAAAGLAAATAPPAGGAPALL
jgi:CPA2 family monovalent cation:H+ antiporter-2